MRRFAPWTVPNSVYNQHTMSDFSRDRPRDEDPQENAPEHVDAAIHDERLQPVAVDPEAGRPVIVDPDAPLADDELIAPFPAPADASTVVMPPVHPETGIMPEDRPVAAAYVPVEPAVVDPAAIRPIPAPVPLEEEHSSQRTLLFVLIALAVLGLLGWALWQSMEDEDGSSSNRKPATQTTDGDQADPLTDPSTQDPGAPNVTPAPDTDQPDTPTTDTPTTDTPSTDTPTTDTPGTNTPSTDTPGTNTPSTDTPGTGTPGTDTPQEAPAPKTLADIASDPQAYIGDKVDVQGAYGKLVNESAFFGDGVLVAASSMVEEQSQSTMMHITGTVQIVDDAFRSQVGEEFFDGMSYEQLKGKAVIFNATAEPA